MFQISVHNTGAQPSSSSSSQERSDDDVQQNCYCEWNIRYRRERENLFVDLELIVLVSCTKVDKLSRSKLSRTKIFNKTSKRKKEKLSNIDCHLENFRGVLSV